MARFDPLCVVPDLTSLSLVSLTCKCLMLGVFLHDVGVFIYMHKGLCFTSADASGSIAVCVGKF